MQTSKKILIGIVSIIVAIFAIFMVRWLIRYQFYNNYRDDLSSYGYEEGKPFQAISESSSTTAAERPHLILFLES